MIAEAATKLPLRVASENALFLDNRLDNRQEISGSDLLLVFYFQVVAEI
jgi:hypothetical protein